MCGVFYIYDQTRSADDLQCDFAGIAKKGLSDRGPDGASEAQGEHWFAMHCLLSITGATKQPASWEHGSYLFNGEIYNDWQQYAPDYGDADYLKDRLDRDGVAAMHDLDGEFALVVVDETKGLLHLAADTFGTKPFYYAADNGRIAAASYDFILQKCGFEDAQRVPANTALTFHLETGKLVEQRLLRPFDFNNQVCDSYEPFGNAFNFAVRKRSERVQRKIYVPVSSGHDSGIIAAELDAMDIPFTAYGFPFGEIEEIFNERYARFRNRNIRCEILQPDMAELDLVQRELQSGIPKFRLTLDPNAPSLYADDDIRNITGYISAAYIAKKGRENGELIALSGQGADEIISDYYNPHSNSRRSHFRGEWEKATEPWPSFYGGWNKLFLESNERIVGHYGIETRYPFLDYGVVQAFLNLTPDMKRDRYKGCIAHRMDQLGYPYHDRKLGFAGFERELPDQITTNV